MVPDLFSPLKQSFLEEEVDHLQVRVVSGVLINQLNWRDASCVKQMCLLTSGSFVRAQSPYATAEDEAVEREGLEMRRAWDKLTREERDGHQRQDRCQLLQQIAAPGLPTWVSSHFSFYKWILY